MKVCFVTGSKFIIDYDGDIYTNGSYSDKIWKRYEENFGNLTVIARIEEKKIDKAEANKKYNHFNNKKYEFVNVENDFKSVLSFFDFKIKRKNKKIMKKYIKETDVLIVRVPSSISYLAIKYAKKYNKRYICEMVGCPWDSLWNHSWKGKILAPIKWYTAKICLKNAENVIYVTNEFLQKRYPTLGKNIGCSDVELKKSDDKVLSNRLQKIKMKSENEKIVLATLAAINVKYKGQAYVIKAIAELNKIGFNFEYQLAGGGSKERLEKLAEKLGVTENVKFLGSIPHEEIFDWLDDVDIYIQPSKQEGLPRALIEAISRGCPCIGSNTGGIPELIDKSYIFKKGNVKMLIDILRNYSKEKQLEQAKKNFSISKNYTKEKLDQKRNAFYDEFKLNLSK